MANYSNMTEYLVHSLDSNTNWIMYAVLYLLFVNVNASLDIIVFGIPNIFGISNRSEINVNLFHYLFSFDTFCPPRFLPSITI